MQQSASLWPAPAKPRASMLAHVLVKPGEIVLRELPLPVPGPEDIVVRVRAALTCGTDVKAFVRGHPKFPMPTPFGHEFAGEAAAVGTRVRGIREGDAVMATPTAPCGACYACARGQENLCDTIMDTMVLGAYAEYIKVPARIVRVNVYHKPPHLAYPEAALLEPLACVMHGIEHIAPRPDDRVVLIGAGAISLLHLLALRSRGVEWVAVLGRRPPRAAHAKQLGADLVLDGGVDANRDAVLAATGGRGADVVIECTGLPDVWEAAPALARRGGTVTLFGGCPPGTHLRIDTQRLHYDQLRVLSPFHFTPRAVRAAYELLSREHFAGAALISGAYRLENLPQALDAHQSGTGIKFAVLP